MTRNIAQALKEDGLRAEYSGNPARVLPATPAIIETLDEAGKSRLNAGHMALAYNDGEKRVGKVIKADANNPVTLLIPRANGEGDLRIPASDTRQAALAVVRAEQGAAEQRRMAEKANTDALADYEAAIGRGEAPEEPVRIQDEFAADAFVPANRFVECVRETQLALRDDPFSGIAEKAAADSFTAKLRDLTRDNLAADAKARAVEAKQIRAQIAMIAPDHAEAANAVVPQPYEGDGEAARALAAQLPQDPQGVSAAQASAMAGKMDMALVNRLFSVATTTPPMRVVNMPLSHAGFRTIEQELARHVDVAATESIVPRMTAVTKDAMSGYDWQGRVYSVNDADVLLMRDQYAAFAYVWDSESRVMDLDVNVVIGELTEADVPSEEELETLRATLADLRFDNGAEIDFDAGEWTPIDRDGEDLADDDFDEQDEWDDEPGY